MNQMRWLNRSQPQTLFSAVLLCYFSAVLLVLGSGIDTLLAREVFERIAAIVLSDGTVADLSSRILPSAVTLLLGGAYVAGGAGTANERRWGHWLCSAAAIYAAMATLWWGARTGFELGVLMRLMFDALLLVLLYHPMSRGYRRVWFQ